MIHDWLFKYRWRKCLEVALIKWTALLMDAMTRAWLFEHRWRKCLEVALINLPALLMDAISN